MTKDRKCHGNEMDAARQRLRVGRMGWRMISGKYCNMSPATGLRTRSASSDCVVRTVLFVPDPLEVYPAGAYRSTLHPLCAGRSAAKNGKIYGKGMNVVRSISRRFGRTTGARTRSAASDCIVRTVSFGPGPRKPGGVRENGIIKSNESERKIEYECEN